MSAAMQDVAARLSEATTKNQRTIRTLPVRSFVRLSQTIVLPPCHPEGVDRFWRKTTGNRRIYEFLAKVLLCVAGTNGINTSWKMVVGQFELTFRQHCHAERTGARLAGERPGESKHPYP